MTVPTNLPEDRLGREIKVGDYVLWAISNSSSAALRYGKVVALPSLVQQVCVDYGTYDPATGTRSPRQYEARNVYKVKAAPCEKDGSLTMKEEYDDSMRKFISTGRPVTPVTLAHLDRVVVIPN